LQNNTSSSKKSGENSQVIKLVISDYEELQATAVQPYSTQTKELFFTDVSYALLKGEGVMPEQPPEA